ncbi:CotD family spore coat protein [Peribacillus muralis]|uniref:CotD family spore coat protein n=1 Tax=Peribacillus muralis TaxID=264697 RepID=UPI00380B2E6C
MGGVEMYNKSWGLPPGNQRPSQCCPPQNMPVQHDPSQTSPTRHYVKTNIINTVIPVFHPAHTTTVNKHVITYQHYFPYRCNGVNGYYPQGFGYAPPGHSYSRSRFR